MDFTPNFKLRTFSRDERPWDAINYNAQILDAALTQWTSIPNLVGVWANSTAYTVGQRVIDAATSAIWSCLVGHTSQASPTTFLEARDANPTYWEQITSPVNELAAAAAKEAVPQRNYINNGQFKVWQRGTTLNAHGNDYSADQWITFRNGSGGTLNVTANGIDSQELFDKGISFFLRYELTGSISGATVTDLAAKIEDVSLLSGRVVTLAFWAKRTVAVGQINCLLVQNFGTGGSPSSEVTTLAGFFTPTTTWTRYVMTVFLPSVWGKTFGSNNNHHLQVIWRQPNNQAHTWDIAEASLRPTNVDVQFEPLPYGVELENCQRWLQSVTCGAAGYGTTGIGIAHRTPFNRAMRTTPSAITPTMGTQTNITSGTISIVDGYCVSLGGTITSTGAYVLVGSAIASAEL